MSNTKPLPIGRRRVVLGSGISGEAKAKGLDKIKFNAGSAFTKRQRDLYEKTKVEKVNARSAAIKSVRSADETLKKGKGKAKANYSTEAGELPITAELVYAEPKIDLVTVEQLKKIYPIKASTKYLEEAVKIINDSIEGMDSVFAEHYRDNVIGLIDVLRGQKRVNFEQYAKAVKFCTYKLAGNTDVRAYSLTFPERISRLQAERVPMSYLYSYATAYAQNKTVSEVMAKALIPSHIMYHDYFHMAIKTQVEIMSDTSVSPKVRSDAANSLITHLKREETKKAELSIDVKDSGAISDLREVLSGLANKQRTLVEEGIYTVTDVSKTKLLNSEVTDE